MTRFTSALVVLLGGLCGTDLVGQEPPSNLLFTREASVVLEDGGRLEVSLPNFLPPEALGRGAMVRLPGAERRVTGLTGQNFLSASGPRTRLYEHILRNLFLRSDGSEQEMVARRVEELRVTSGLVGASSTVVEMLQGVQAIEGVGRAAHLPGALRAVSTVLEVDRGMTEGELNALLLYAGFIAGAGARIEAFVDMQRRSAWRDPALEAAVGNVTRELDRLLEEEIENLVVEYRTRGGAGAAARSTVEIFASLVMGHGTAAVLAGGMGVAVGAALPAAFFFGLSRQHDLIEVMGVLVLGATMREKLFRPDLREGRPASPEESLLLLEMQDQLLITLRDAAIQYAGDPNPPAGVRPTAGLLDPNSGSATEGLRGRQYWERAWLFHRGVQVPNPLRERLDEQVVWRFTVTVASGQGIECRPAAVEWGGVIEVTRADGGALFEATVHPAAGAWNLAPKVIEDDGRVVRVVRRNFPTGVELAGLVSAQFGGFGVRSVRIHTADAIWVPAAESRAPARHFEPGQYTVTEIIENNRGGSCSFRILPPRSGAVIPTDLVASDDLNLWVLRPGGMLFVRDCEGRCSLPSAATIASQLRAKGILSFAGRFVTRPARHWGFVRSWFDQSNSWIATANADVFGSEWWLFIPVGSASDVNTLHQVGVHLSDMGYSDLLDIFCNDTRHYLHGFVMGDRLPRDCRAVAARAYSMDR